MIGHVVISEVYYDVDMAHGTEPANEWVELYNGTESSVDVGGWTIGDTNSPMTDRIPATTLIPAGGFIILTASSTTASFWTIPADVAVINIGSPLGNGLGNDGDTVFLKNAGVTVDALSYGSTTPSVFNPPAPDVAEGHSLARINLTSDTDTASDFEDRAIPSPGVF